MINDRDRILMEGTVIETHRGGLFKLIVAGNVLMAKPSGKIQQNMIKIIVGDKVKVEISPYDTSKGRITMRLK